MRTDTTEKWKAKLIFFPPTWGLEEASASALHYGERLILVLFVELKPCL